MKIQSETAAKTTIKSIEAKALQAGKPVMVRAATYWGYGRGYGFIPLRAGAVLGMDTRLELQAPNQLYPTLEQVAAAVDAEVGLF